MSAKACTAAVSGIEAYPLELEVTPSSGIGPEFAQRGELRRVDQAGRFRCSPGRRL
jgi:hypothetical protein